MLTFSRRFMWKCAAEGGKKLKSTVWPLGKNMNIDLGV
jgi:hypothetical protein